MGIVHATATSTFRGDSGRFISGRITPAVRAGVQAFADLVLEEAKAIVPVDTGELRDSGSVVVVEGAKSVTAHVVFSAGHGSFIEFGWGALGASGPNAGPYAYNTSIRGYAGSAFLRPALDTSRQAGKELFNSQVSAAMKF